MPTNVTINAEELKALLAERDLAEERLRAYRRELFGAKSEAREPNQPSLFNEAETLGANSAPAQEKTRRRLRSPRTSARSVVIASR